MTRKLPLNKQSEWATPTMTILNNAALAAARLAELLERKRSSRGVLATPRALRYPNAAVPFRSAAPTAGA